MTAPSIASQVSDSLPPSTQLPAFVTRARQRRRRKQLDSAMPVSFQALGGVRYVVLRVRVKAIEEKKKETKKKTAIRCSVKSVRHTLGANQADSTHHQERK